MFKYFKLALVTVLLLMICSCDLSPGNLNGVGGGGGTGTTVGKLYVANAATNSILRFDSALTATGDVAPAATITGGSTQLLSPQRILLDTVANRLFVANQGGASILIFEAASTKTGNIIPDRVISGASTSMAAPFDVALDSGRDLLYVADGPNILVFSSASTVSGNVVPGRTIAPQFANVGFAIGAILLDTANDRLYVADDTNQAIQVFDTASVLNGPFNAVRTITGAATQLAQPEGLELDTQGRLIVSNVGTPIITIYANAATATGNVAPVATIAGTATTLTGPTQMALDPATSNLYVADGLTGAAPIFGNIATANGNIPPSRDITGPTTGLARTGAATAAGVALDSTR